MNERTVRRLVNEPLIYSARTQCQTDHLADLTGTLWAYMIHAQCQTQSDFDKFTWGYDACNCWFSSTHACELDARQGSTSGSALSSQIPGFNLRLNLPATRAQPPAQRSGLRIFIRGRCLRLCLGLAVVCIIALALPALLCTERRSQHANAWRMPSLQLVGLKFVLELLARTQQQQANRVNVQCRLRTWRGQALALVLAVFLCFSYGLVRQTKPASDPSGRNSKDHRQNRRAHIEWYCSNMPRLIGAESPHCVPRIRLNRFIVR